MRHSQLASDILESHPMRTVSLGGTQLTHNQITIPHWAGRKPQSAPFHGAAFYSPPHCLIPKRPPFAKTVGERLSRAAPSRTSQSPHRACVPPTSCTQSAGHCAGESQRRTVIIERREPSSSGPICRQASPSGEAKKRRFAPLISARRKTRVPVGDRDVAEFIIVALVGQHDARTFREFHRE